MGRPAGSQGPGGNGFGYRRDGLTLRKGVVSGRFRERRRRGGHDYAPLLLRICLVVLFPFSALDTILNGDAAMKQAGAIPFKAAVIVASIIVEFVAPVCIVTGWHSLISIIVSASPARRVSVSELAERRGS